MAVKLCGFSGQPIGPEDRVVLLTSEHSRAGPFDVEVLENVFFGWFAGRFEEVLPGLRPAKLPERPNVRWVFDPERFGGLATWKAARILVALLNTDRSVPLLICPIPFDRGPIALDIREFASTSV